MQGFLRVQFAELRKSTFSIADICMLLGQGKGRGTRENSLKMVTVLCNVATLIANDYPRLTKNHNGNDISNM